MSSNEYYNINEEIDNKRTDDSNVCYGLKANPKINYKFREDELIKELQKYIDSTYSQHYSSDKFQALEFIFDGGHGEGFNVGNILKYAQRYGKKGNRADSRRDMIKVIHYALLQLYIHDEETNFLESPNKFVNTKK